VSDWLSNQGILINDAEFYANELDGNEVLKLIDLWTSNKTGFLDYTRDSLGIATPGHTLRIASLIHGIQLKDGHLIY
jgi:hypothetical protein